MIEVEVVGNATMYDKFWIFLIYGLVLSVGAYLFSVVSGFLKKLINL